MDIERIRSATRALIGEEQDVGYITTELLSELEREGRELIDDGEPGRVFRATRIVDAVRYVAFYDGSTPIWLEKPVSLVPTEDRDRNQPIFRIARLSRRTNR